MKWNLFSECKSSYLSMNAWNAYDDMLGFKVLNTRGVTAPSPLKESRPEIQNLGLSNGKGNVSSKHITS